MDNKEMAKNQLSKEERRELQLNFWGSLALSIFAVAFIIASTQIRKISTAKWYDSPSLFPLVIGGCLLIFCLIYLWQNRKGCILSKEDIQAMTAYLKSSTFFRLMVSVATLAVYIFVLLGLQIGSIKLPYEAATFIYLFATMTFFRPKGYAIWKIVLISLVLSVCVGYGFSHFAKIPLP